MTTDQQEEARRAEADAEGLFQQLMDAEGLPNAADLESSPIIQRLPSSVEQVEDISVLDEGAKRVTVSPDNLSPDDLMQMPRNSNEGGGLTVGGQTFTGKRVVYRTDTGRPWAVLTYFLPTVLKKLRDDGKLAFTLRDPGKRPPKGQYPCYLNSGAPEADDFHRMGFPECPMGELPTETDRDDHMRNKHQAEWRRIEDIRVRTERIEDRESMHMMREALAVSLGNQTIPSSSTSVTEPVAPVADSATDTPLVSDEWVAEHVDPKPFSASCGKCDKVTKGKSQAQADNFLRLHDKSHKED